MLPKRLPWLILAPLVIAGFGCQGIKTIPLEPAWFETPSAHTREVVESTLASALSVATISLSQNVFADSHVLVLERATTQGIGRPQTGRSLTVPPRFELYTDGNGSCILHRPATMEQWRLGDLRCLPAPDISADDQISTLSTR